MNKITKHSPLKTNSIPQLPKLLLEFSVLKIKSKRLRIAIKITNTTNIQPNCFILKKRSKIQKPLNVVLKKSRNAKFLCFFLGYQNPKKPKKTCWRKWWRKFVHPPRSGASLSQRGETAGFLRSSPFQVDGPKGSVGETISGVVRVGLVFWGSFFGEKTVLKRLLFFFFFVGGGGGEGVVVFVGVEAFGSG